MTALRTRVDADLSLSVTFPDQPDRPPVGLALSGAGSSLTLRVDDPALFAGSEDADALRRVALELAGLGLVVRVRDARGSLLLSMGDVRSPWWQRAVTRSPHLRVAGLRGLLAAGRGRQRGLGSSPLPERGLVPPSTPYPLAPTFLRRPVRRVTTTHDPARGGLPRLVELPGPRAVPTAHPTHWLQHDRVVVGSAPDCDIVLPGLAPHHAEVHHDRSDEFVLVALHPDVRVHGRPVQRLELRTGARIELGERVLAFVREEYADHGRPYGGRIGGELGVQRRQPPRPAPKDGPDF